MEDAEDECRGEHNEPGKRRKIGERETEIMTTYNIYKPYLAC